MSETICAFCKGKGKDPFELLSKLANCQVCGGKGKVEVIEPAIKCAFCKGTGIYPRDGRVTCTVCNGKGMVTVKGETEGCPKCKGSGQEIESGLPCIKCGGKGVVLKR
jgi:DnaJ-class molecular chaperone